MNPLSPESLVEDVHQTQGMRIRRLLLGAVWGGFILMLLSWIAFQMGFFRADNQIFLTIFGIIWSGYLAFFIVFLLGLNKRFSDPTLSLPFMIWSVIGIMLSAYFVDQVRLSVMTLFFGVMLMGAFSGSIRHFVITGALGIIGYVAVIFAIDRFHPEAIDFPAEMIQWASFTVLAIGYAFLGSEIAIIRGRLSDKNADLGQALKRINELAIKDDLTGAFNRRHAMDILRHQKSMADRGAYDFAVLYVDLDHFKRVNDTFGHPAGDEVLRRFVRTSEEIISDIDYCCRFGGEEFVLILVKTSEDQARQLAEKLRLAIADIDFSDVAEELSMTVSMGLTLYRPPEALETVLTRADKALYESKHNGRDRLTIA